MWLVSDTHFGHHNIYMFMDATKTHRIRSEFKDAKEGDAAMIDRWNAVVRPQDHVYHLGDVAMSKPYYQMVRGLNGHKRLILGNHDTNDMGLLKDVGFQKIMASRKYGKMIFSHYPLHPDSLPKWCLGNVHGHIHEKPSPPGRYFNVSVERIGYTPIPVEEVEQHLIRLQV